MIHRDPTPPLFAPQKFAGYLKALAVPPAPPVDPNTHPDDAARLTGQNAEVLRRLRAGERLTFHAAEAAGIHRLAARVADLRAAGYPVVSERDADRKCAVYWMQTP